MCPNRHDQNYLTQANQALAPLPIIDGNRSLHALSFHHNAPEHLLLSLCLAATRSHLFLWSNCFVRMVSVIIIKASSVMTNRRRPLVLENFAPPASCFLAHHLCPVHPPFGVVRFFPALFPQ